jgi:hypothetical protein
MKGNWRKYCTESNLKTNNYEHNFQELKPSNGNSQDAPLLMNGLRKCGIYTQWNFTQS